MTWWLSASFTALLVVTVVWAFAYLLPALWAPSYEPDFEDVDELARRDR